MTQEGIAPATNAPVSEAPKEYCASIHPGPQHAIPAEFVQIVQALEETLGMPLWLFIHDEKGEAKFDDISEELRKAFWMARRQMTPNSPIALLIDSPGGQAKSAYQI